MVWEVVGKGWKGEEEIVKNRGSGKSERGGDGR